jgi:hypothetical protein
VHPSHSSPPSDSRQHRRSLHTPPSPAPSPSPARPPLAILLPRRTTASSLSDLRLPNDNQYCRALTESEVSGRRKISLYSCCQAIRTLGDIQHSSSYAAELRLALENMILLSFCSYSYRLRLCQDGTVSALVDKLFTKLRPKIETCPQECMQLAKATVIRRELIYASRGLYS